MSRSYLCPCLNDAFLRLRQVVFRTTYSISVVYAEKNMNASP